MGLDHVVHINDGSDTKKPIVLHLLPGEETIFNLVVFNDGDPSDLSLLASDPVFKAVRFQRSDSHVDMKQTIPVFARMPNDVNRLDGEIVLMSSNGESRVPITILRDSGGPQTDQLLRIEPKRAGPSDRSYRISSRAKVRDIPPLDEALKEDYEDEESDLDDEIIDPEAGDFAEKDEDHDPYSTSYGESDSTSYDTPYDTSRDEDSESMPEENDGNEEGKTDRRHIAFSKDQDLESYRAARRFRRVEDLSENQDETDDFSSRGEDYTDGSNERRDPFIFPEEDQRFKRDDAKVLDGFFRTETGRRTPFELGSQGDNPEQVDTDQPLTEEEIFEDDDFRSIGAMQIIPAIIFLGLVAALVLTFMTESIPEFPGALASSILIVTLIIYGAATLLKA